MNIVPMVFLSIIILVLCVGAFLCGFAIGRETK